MMNRRPGMMSLTSALLVLLICRPTIAQEDVVQDRAEPQNFTFVQMCDPHLDEKPDFVKRYKQALAQINELSPDFVIITGDMAA